MSKNHLWPFFKNPNPGEVLSGPPAKTPSSRCRGAEVWSLLTELDPTCRDWDPVQTNKLKKKKDKHLDWKKKIFFKSKSKLPQQVLEICIVTNCPKEFIPQDKFRNDD